MDNEIDLNAICYNKNYLSEVIARIDLVSPLSSLEKEMPKEFSKIALEHFPIAEPKPVFTQELFVTQNELATRKKEFTEWNFHGESREKRLTVTPNAFFVTYKRYQKYENLREEFIALVEGFFRTFVDAQPKRIGLRYINELELDEENPLDWNEAISPEILGLLSYSVEGATPSRIFSTIEMVFNDFNMRFQFGIHNPDYPAPIRRKVFILDYDAYFQGLFENRDIASKLDCYHEAIQKMFERNIKAKIREAMNAVK